MPEVRRDTFIESASGNLAQVLTSIAQQQSVDLTLFTACAQVQATLAQVEATDRQTAAVVDMTEAIDRNTKQAEHNGESLAAIQEAVANIDLDVHVDMEFPDQLLRAIDRLLLALR